MRRAGIAPLAKSQPLLSTDVAALRSIMKLGVQGAVPFTT